MISRSPARSYPRKADIARAVQSARENGLLVRSLEVRSDGSIRLSSSDRDNGARDEPQTDFDLWDEAGRL